MRGIDDGGGLPEEVERTRCVLRILRACSLLVIFLELMVGKNKLLNITRHCIMVKVAPKGNSNLFTT